MTQREKNLVIVMGAALGLLGGYKLINTVVLEPREDLKREILAARQNKESLENRGLGEVAAQRNWRNHTQHTLAATSPNSKAHDLFRADVIELLKKNGLPHTNVQLRQPAAPQGSKNYRKGF